MDTALGISGRVDAEGTGTSRRIARRAAVACEVPLGEYLDKGVFAVTLDGARITDAGGTVVRLAWVVRRRIAGQTGEYALAERAKRFGAVLNALCATLGVGAGEKG